jgi:Tfp pilus assembly protein PilV
MKYTARRGVTMMEAAIGTLLVGGVLAATLHIVGPTVRVTANAADRLLAVALAEDLLDEIASRPYADPTDDTDSIGFDSGENFNVRKDFDDVDDFHGYTANGEHENGDPLGLGSGWERSVVVQYVISNEPAVVSVDANGVKRATVVVRRHGVLLAERSILRTASFDLARATP